MPELAGQDCSSPASSTAATSGAPTWTRRWRKLATLLGSAGCRRGVDVVLAAARARTRWSRETDLDDALRSWLAFGAREGRRGGRRWPAHCATAATRSPTSSPRRTRRRGIAQVRPSAAQRRVRAPARRDRGVRHRTRHVGRAAPRSQDERLRPAAAADHHDRLVPADRGDPQGPRGAARRARSNEAEYAQRMRDEIADVIALQEKLGLDVLVHGEPERNDMVQYFAEQLDGFSATAERLGAVLRHPLRTPADPLRRRRRGPHADDRRLDHLRAVADRQAGQGHAHRSGDDPGVVVRARRPAARRHRRPGRAGPPRRDGGPARPPASRIIQVDEPALRELLPLRARRPGRLPGLGGRRVPAVDLRRRATRRRSTRTCATRSSARSSTRSTTSTPTSPPSRRRARTWRCSTTSPRSASPTASARASTTSTRRGCRATSEIAESLRAALRAVPGRPAVGQPGLRSEDPRHRRGRPRR